MKYDMSTYGNGPVAEKLVAIPNQDGNYFTAGKEYPVVAHTAWVYIVLCDKGHQRAISMESGARSAHLSPKMANQHLHYGFSSNELGSFEIRRVS